MAKPALVKSYFPEGKFAMRKFSKKSIVAAATLALLALGGTAFAYWTSTGNGSGSATTGTSSNWVVTSEAATGGALSPGGPTDTVLVHVNNPATSGVQHLNAVSVAVANSDGTAWTAVPGCSAADYTVSIAVTPADVAAGATVTETASITMKNLQSSQDGCKSATVPLYFVAS